MIYIYIFIYLYLFIFICIYLYLFIFICIYLFIYICLYFVFICIYLYLFVFIYLYIIIYIYIFIFIYRIISPPISTHQHLDTRQSVRFVHAEDLATKAPMSSPSGMKPIIKVLKLLRQVEGATSSETRHKLNHCDVSCQARITNKTNWSLHLWHQGVCCWEPNSTA